MRFVICLVALIFGLLPSVCLAETNASRSVQDLYLHCKDERGIKLGYCFGYIVGVADMMVTLASIEARARDGTPLAMRLCNASYTAGSLRQLFINWAEKNPQWWTADQIIGVGLAFEETWPCE